MLAHLIEASTGFKTGTVLSMYLVIFVTLGVIAAIGYIAAIRRQEDRNKN